MSKLSFKHKRMMVRECQRIQFLLKRDGIEKTVEFSKQGIEQYNSSLKTGYGKLYSDELRASILIYTIFLNYII